MHYFKNLCSFAVFSTLIAATVASPAPGADAKGVVSPAPDTASVQSPHPGAKKFTLETQGPTPEVAPQFIGVLIMYTTSGCAAGGSSETWEIYGYPGAYGCLPVPAGWVTESVTFSQGIGKSTLPMPEEVPLTRHRSSAVNYNNLVSGPFWYASGATVQVLLFATLAIELKRKSPNAHTFREVIKARYGVVELLEEKTWLLQRHESLLQSAAGESMWTGKPKTCLLPRVWTLQRFLGFRQTLKKR
ncbi:hypothetical protein BDR22DRAFT_893702 [Usnea florida]